MPLFLLLNHHTSFHSANYCIFQLLYQPYCKIPGILPSLLNPLLGFVILHTPQSALHGIAATTPALPGTPGYPPLIAVFSNLLLAPVQRYRILTLVIRSLKFNILSRSNTATLKNPFISNSGNVALKNTL